MGAGFARGGGMSLSEFLYQGGYAFFVWGVYGMWLLLMIGEIFTLYEKRRAALTEIKRAQRRHNIEDVGEDTTPSGST